MTDAEGQLSWLPGNDIEAELYSALVADDRRRFFRAVVAAPWYLPALPPVDGGQRFLTHELLGETYLLVFTSPRSLAFALGGAVTGCTVTGYPELARRWPEPSWRLAVNAGTPVDAWLTLPALAEAAAGTRTVPTLAGAVTTGSEPEVDAVLDDYLSQLHRLELLVPASSHDPAAYHVARRHGQLVIDAFTSARMLAAAHPGATGTFRTTLAELVVHWPGAGYALAIDPGSDTELVVSGAQLPGLLLWGPQGGSPPTASGGTASPLMADVEYIDRNSWPTAERG